MADRCLITFPRVLPSGDGAITVEYGRVIDDDANARVLALDRLVADRNLIGVHETVPTYRSLLVHYDPLVASFDKLGETLLELARRAHPATTARRHWRIPVAYGGEHGVDLAAAAGVLGITRDALVARHAAGDYRVAMIGFTPGWSYLSGLDPALQIPRRKEPRVLTPSGTISIGGVQTGIQCIPGPSGWHLLGRTPVRTFQPGRDPVFLLEPGDRISLQPIDDGQFAEQERAAAAGDIVAERIA